MAESIQIVAYTGGELRVLSGGIDPGEAVLALPLSRLVVKMVRVAEGEREFDCQLTKKMPPLRNEVEAFTLSYHPYSSPIAVWPQCVVH